MLRVYLLYRSTSLMARVDPDVVLMLYVVSTANMTDLGADQRNSR